MDERDGLDAAQHDSLSRDGFTLLPRVLGRLEVDNLVADLDRTLDERDKTEVSIITRSSRVYAA